MWAGQNEIYSSQMVTGLRRLKMMMMMMMVTLSLVSRDLDHFSIMVMWKGSHTKEKAEIILEMKLSSE